ncbi:MAG: hypothetical protein JKY43_01255 [Phycisphaerales bacterium]|nr:hypothetical protein [Phycisphaerales bacterium]
MTDAFHDHSNDPAPQEAHAQTVSPKALGITLILMVLGVLAVIFILIAYFDNFMSNYHAEINETTAISGPTWEAKQTSLQSLNTYGWVNNTTAHQPIDNAVEQVITEYASN